MFSATFFFLFFLNSRSAELFRLPKQQSQTHNTYTEQLAVEAGGSRRTVGNQNHLCSAGGKRIRIDGTAVVDSSRRRPL